MESGTGFLIAVCSLVVATISMICDVIGVYRGKTMESFGNLLLTRRYVVIGMLFLITWTALAFDYYDRTRHVSYRWDESRPLIQVRDKTFTMETVALDGREFIHCKFINVTFAYEGTAPTRLTDSSIKITKEGDLMVRLYSTNPIVGQTWLLGHSILQASGVSIGNVSIEIGP